MVPEARQNLVTAVLVMMHCPRGAAPPHLVTIGAAAGTLYGWAEINIGTPGRTGTMVRTVHERQRWTARLGRRRETGMAGQVSCTKNWSDRLSSLARGRRALE